MLSTAIWLIFLGNYLILFSFMHINLYFENIVFYIYSLSALILGLVILTKINKVKINANALLIAVFIISIITSIFITFHSVDKDGMAKFLYIFLCIIVTIEAYILGLNRDIFKINFKLIKSLSLFSIIVMLSIMSYDILILKVFRFAKNTNAIGTSRAIIFGFLFIFSINYFKKKYLISGLFYLAGLIIAFISGTRQVFISYLLLILLYPLIPYFKGLKLFSFKNTVRNLLLIFFLLAVFFSIYDTQIKGGEISEEKSSYIDIVFQRYHGGYHGKFTAINEREKLLIETFDSIYSKPIFGDFQYNEKLGNFAHLMLIDIFASFGIFPLLLFIFINFIVILKFSFRMMKQDLTYFIFFTIFIFLSIPSLLVTTFLIHPFYYFVLFYLLGFKKEISKPESTSDGRTKQYAKLIIV